MTAAPILDIDPQLDPRCPVGRLERLCDPGTLQLIDEVDGAVAGTGRLDGTATVVFATDPRRMGGALGADSCDLVVRAYDVALAEGLPVVGVWQSGGARLAEGTSSLHGFSRVFSAMTAASGTVPQISVVLGPAAGGAAYGPALSDVVVLGPAARVFVTGPDVVRSVTGEDLDADALGGPAVHSKQSGVAHVVARTEDEAMDRARRLVALLSNGLHTAPAPKSAGDLAATLPESRRRAYDVHAVIDGLLDAPGEELHRRWAPNVVTTLGRLGGRTVGVLANNPLQLGGCLTATASDKAARFVRLCDSLGIPLVVLVDVPGYLPGGRQETDGVVRRGAKLLHAFAAARVPRVTVILRKAYGGAYIAMNSRGLGATTVLAWEGAEVDVMDPLAAVRILRRRDLAPLTGSALTDAEQAYADEHAIVTGGLQRAVQDGLIDAVIPPDRTREEVLAALAAARPDRGRLTNIPL